MAETTEVPKNESDHDEIILPKVQDWRWQQKTEKLEDITNDEEVRNYFLRKDGLIK